MRPILFLLLYLGQIIGAEPALTTSKDSFAAFVGLKAHHIIPTERAQSAYDAALLLALSQSHHYQPHQGLWVQVLHAITQEVPVETCPIWHDYLVHGTVSNHPWVQAWYRQQSTLIPRSTTTTAQEVLLKLFTSISEEKPLSRGLLAYYQNIVDPLFIAAYQLHHAQLGRDPALSRYAMEHVASALACIENENSHWQHMELIEPGIRQTTHWNPQNRRKHNKRLSDYHQSLCTEGHRTGLPGLPAKPGAVDMIHFACAVWAWQHFNLSLHVHNPTLIPLYMPQYQTAFPDHHALARISADYNNSNVALLSAEAHNRYAHHPQWLPHQINFLAESMLIHQHAQPSSTKHTAQYQNLRNDRSNLPGGLVATGTFTNTQHVLALHIHCPGRAQIWVGEQYNFITDAGGVCRFPVEKNKKYDIRIEHYSIDSAPSASVTGVDADNESIELAATSMVVGNAPGIIIHFYQRTNTQDAHYRRVNTLIEESNQQAPHLPGLRRLLAQEYAYSRKVDALHDLYHATDTNDETIAAWYLFALLLDKANNAHWKDIYKQIGTKHPHCLVMLPSWVHTRLQLLTTHTSEIQIVPLPQLLPPDEAGTQLASTYFMHALLQDQWELAARYAERAGLSSMEQKWGPGIIAWFAFLHQLYPDILQAPRHPCHVIWQQLCQRQLAVSDLSTACKEAGIGDMDGLIAALYYLRHLELSYSRDLFHRLRHSPYAQVADHISDALGTWQPQNLPQIELPPHPAQWQSGDTLDKEAGFE